MQGPRGACAGEFTEKQYDIIDAVGKVAGECKTDSSTVALAWLKTRPGVSSVIIGARTLQQLDANLKALDLILTPEQITYLDEASKPVLNFPADFLTHSPSMLLKNPLRQVEQNDSLLVQSYLMFERWPFQAIAASGCLLWLMNRTNRFMF